MIEKFENAEFGIEAVIMDGNENHPYRAVLRDVDADKTVSVIFGSYEQVLKVAKDFVK